MSTPGPLFFCTRPDGTLTPLMPLDEMPVGMVFRGVSRVISPSDTQGMTSCGLAAKRSEGWAIESLGQDQPIKDPEINKKIRKMLVDVLKLENIPVTLRQDVSDLVTKGIETLEVTASQSMAVVPAPQIQACLSTGVVNHQKPQVNTLFSFDTFSLTDHS